MDGINVNSRGTGYALKIVLGTKTIETRGRNSLKSHIGQRVYIVETGNGPARVLGEVTIGEPKIYHGTDEFDQDFEEHDVGPDSKWYIKEGGIKYGYPMLNPVMYSEWKVIGACGGRVVRKNLEV